ncbi:cyclase [Mycobacterium asiaticum]|uniref:Cyclase n=1 Tax=Mycobacterium asiaticum TaxID=1790 RepID=A0A1A3NS44_MYCAS|nr:adenylate/guanylate cyclase domain-containing protein [Mycobacterium asiaticum]OBK23864.1 cyclase [Mycobacterium asiaticum]
MTTVSGCRTCGTAPLENARFCHSCGAPVSPVSAARAEYKQVTVLFADVVHSMDIAAAVGAERLREIMAELVGRCAAVVQRYGGTVDKFTGDGIMAVFGAPVALEDHAVRAGLAAMDVQDAAKELAASVQDRDDVDLRLRVGLNSGQVIAGEIGAGSLGYTAIGEQVGMAQRMESVAPAGGVMLSASTAHLVEHCAVLGASESVRIKGAPQPVIAYRLLGMSVQHWPTGRADTGLIGRSHELQSLKALLETSIAGHAGVASVVGPAGIGKSRLVREVAALAHSRGVDVVTTFCESHARDVPFHAVAQLLGALAGVDHLDDAAARAKVRALVPDVDEDDLILLYDVIGVRDPDVALPNIDPDARRRRFSSLITTLSMARGPALYVIEDAHWIDEVSESLLADLLTLIPKTSSTVLITYRSEYRGLLAGGFDDLSITLAPLDDSQATQLLGELLGTDPSVAGITALICERASGNPFFAEEMARDLAERGMLQGKPGDYQLHHNPSEITVPGTLQATIGARIDRLGPTAKHTLTAAAVIGARFGTEMLSALVEDADLPALIKGEFIEALSLTQRVEYAFRHPLIRAVAYESQLKSDRARLHRRIAEAIQQRDPSAADANAALIAEHLEAAGDLSNAYTWHMRAGQWSDHRDIRAARLSWGRARHVADALTAADPSHSATGIAPRTLLCGSAWRVNASMSEEFEQLQKLCALCDDEASLVMAMAGLAMDHLMHARAREASRLVSEYMNLLESIGDPILTARLTPAALYIKFETGEIIDALPWAQATIDFLEKDPAIATSGMASALAAVLVSRGLGRFSAGLDGWRADFDRAIDLSRGTGPMQRAAVVAIACSSAISAGVLIPDDDLLAEVEEALAIAERSADDIGLGGCRFALGVALMHRAEPDSERWVQLLAQVRDMCLQQRFLMTTVPEIDVYLALQLAQRGDRAAAIPRLQTAADELSDTGHPAFLVATRALVQVLLSRATEADVAQARAAIDRFAASRAGGQTLGEVSLLHLRALLARALEDETEYRSYRDRYRDAARTLGFQGHIACAEALP